MPNHRIVETPRPTYRELAPPDHLRDAVVCFWRHGATEQPSTARVIPDGCVDIVWVGEQPPHVAGPMTEAALYQLPAGTEIVAVRLRPGVAHRLLGVSASELLNLDVPLSDLWPRERVGRWEASIDRKSERDRFAAMAEAISDRLVSDSVDDLVRRLASWMAQNPAAPLVEMERLTGLGERQIRRRFDEAIGYGPKKLQRILRLQRLLWLAEEANGSGRHLSRLAYAAGYADQPHMTREVVTLTGASPRQLLLGSTRSAVSDLFKTPLR